MCLGALKRGTAVATTCLVIFASAASAECDSSKSSNPSSARFRFLVKGETAYDQKIDLTWMRCSLGQKWKEDIGCVGLPGKLTFEQANKGLTSGWRVPTVF